MKRTILEALRSVGAVVAGYAVIVIGTVITLEGLIGGASYYEASPFQHGVGALGTALSGLAGGYVAARLAGRKPLWHAAAVIAILVVEMTWILANGIGPNPAWFDAVGGLTLMAFTALGGWLCATRSRLPARPAAA